MAMRRAYIYVYTYLDVCVYIYMYIYIYTYITDLHGHEKSGAQHKRPVAPAFRPRRYHKKAQTCALLPDRPSVILQGAELPLAVDGQRIFHAPAHVHRHLRVNVMVD